MGIFSQAWGADKTVRIALDTQVLDRPHVSMQGFLHGFETASYKAERVDMDKLRALKPNFWRIGLSPQVLENYSLARQINKDVKQCLVLSDQLALMKGGYQNLRPWLDWDGYERDIRDVIERFKAKNIHIDYFDIWSEPDTKAMWHGSREQALEMFRRTYLLIRSLDSKAKIVGPSVSTFGRSSDADSSQRWPFLIDFLWYITKNRLKFDAISWHEFEQPQSLRRDSWLISSFFHNNWQSHSGEYYLPESHVNEYSGPLDASIPGWALAWLYFLEDADVDWATRACWGRGCQSGLDWLFLDDNRTPTALYWVHRAYAQLPNKRLRVGCSSDKTVALCGKDEKDGRITLLLGRFEGKEKAGAPVDIDIELANLPASIKDVDCVVKRIVCVHKPRALAKGPQLVSQATLPMDKQKLSFHLPDVPDGDVYIVDFKMKE
jgi:hypothetical protein